MKKKDWKQFLLVGVIIVGILKFVQNLQGTGMMSAGFDFGRFINQQPDIVTSLFMWGILVVITSVVLFKAGQPKGM